MKKLLAKQSVADILDCSRQTVMRLSSTGSLPQTIRIGGKVYFPAAETYECIDKILSQDVTPTGHSIHDAA